MKISNFLILHVATCLTYNVFFLQVLNVNRSPDAKTSVVRKIFQVEDYDDMPPLEVDHESEHNDAWKSPR